MPSLVTALAASASGTLCCNVAEPLKASMPEDEATLACQSTAGSKRASRNKASRS
ncbi:hypothetical protein D3C80_2067990 [compost metagenome]